jgi:imidazolonepropionase
VNAAWSLGLEDAVGSIEPGRQADLAIWRVSSVNQLPYWPGADLIRSVVKRGRVVLGR